MRVAFRDQPQKTGDEVQGVEGFGLCQKPRRAQSRWFNGEASEMFVEPGAPDEINLIAWLQYRMHAFGAAAFDEAQMPPVRIRHDFEDDARLTIFLETGNQSFVAPLHDSRPSTHASQVTKKFTPLRELLFHFDFKRERV